MDVSRDVSPEASDQENNPEEEGMEEEDVLTDAPSTPEQLEQFAEELGMSDLASMDPHGVYAAAAASNFSGFSVSTDGLLQLPDLLNAPLLPTPTNADDVNVGGTGNGNGNGNGNGGRANPKKRAFFMMGMFFFVALFGGAGMFGSTHQQNDLAAVASLTSGRPKALSSLALSASPRFGRRLLSSDSSLAQDSSQIKRDDVGEPEDSKALALWHDLAYIHTNTNATSQQTCRIDQLLGIVVEEVEERRGEEEEREEGQELARGTLMAPEKKSSFRGSSANKAIVPYLGEIPPSALFDPHQSSTTTQHVLASALTLQRQMARHAVEAAASDSRHNTSTLLCPKPYGMLNGGVRWGSDDSRVVLLLPSSSVNRASYDQEYNFKTSKEEEEEEWDGTWVEVDAKITSVRKLPMYTHKGISAGVASSAPTSSHSSAHHGTHRAIPL